MSGVARYDPWSARIILQPEGASSARIERVRAATETRSRSPLFAKEGVESVSQTELR